jgi:hypothetical protein
MKKLLAICILLLSSIPTFAQASAGSGVAASMILIGLLISILPAVLAIILFFKVWKMTNDVAQIKELLENLLNKS